MSLSDDTIPDNKVARPVYYFLNIGMFTSGLSLLFASCCAWPIILVILGIGGAWLSIFDVFFAYRLWFLVPAFTLISIVWGWVFFRVKRKLPVRRLVYRSLFATILIIFAVLISENQGVIIKNLFELKWYLSE